MWNIGLLGASGGPSFFGAEYGGWNGQTINFSNTSDSSGTTSYRGIDGAYDSATNRLYDGYSNNTGPSRYSGGYPTWGTVASIAGAATPTIGRAATIGYYNKVAYVYFGTSNGTVLIYRLSDLQLMGTWTLTGITLIYGLAYAGNSGIYLTSGDNPGLLSVIPNIEPTTRSITPNVALPNLPASADFGLAFNGSTFLYRNRTIGDGKVYECSLSDGSPVKTYTSSAPATGYGIYIDYGTKKLYTGGLNETTMLRFSGT